MKKILTLIFLAPALAAVAQKPFYSSPDFSIYPNKVVQGKFTASAISSTEMKSNYQSPKNLYPSADIRFKFSINGRDNELPPGVMHHFTITSGTDASTPIIQFGKALHDTSSRKFRLAPGTRLLLRVDMREVMKSLEEKGYYEALNGDRIYRSDYKGVFVAGSTAPMSWDFDNLATHKELELTDDNGDGIYEILLTLNTKKDEKVTDTIWKLSRNISAYPQYSSPFPISDAIYNMSLEEMLKAIEPDSTFRTGKEWGGVWTRDISYSIILSMAFMQPQVAKYSLLRKVNAKKKIIQDTGTGGAWPVSTDRLIWATAAWDIYLATGDKDWLQQAYLIVKTSLEDDHEVIFDPQTGLVKGESSFLDWRDQTYPKWMQPADIFESECLGTNAVHFRANQVLSQMAASLGKPSEAKKYGEIADGIKKAINQYLWVPTQGYYAQYLYGRNYKMQSPRAEALGEALCVIFGIADKQRAKTLVQRTPVTPFGITCIYPQIPNIPPYHNNAIWPFVQSYWMWAGAETGNDKSVLESMADIYRPAALFLTNKENFEADNGDFNGTVINSSIMLWSLSGNISLVQRILFGLRPEETQLRFEPVVPKAMAGNRSLKNLKYRNAELDIDLTGYGNKIKSFLLDGKPHQAFIPATLTGKHKIKIILVPNATDMEQPINKVANSTSLNQPYVTLVENELRWAPVKGAAKYAIWKNGKLVETITNTSFSINENSYASYSVVALKAENDPIGSFASEPIEINGISSKRVYQLELFAAPAPYNYQGANGTGFVEISTTENSVINIPVRVVEPGTYAINFRYSNGNGPGNTENKCAVRTLFVDDQKAGTIVFPQRGVNEWANWGKSNSVLVKINEGQHTFSLRYEPYDENMNGKVNQAMLDQITLTWIGN